MSEVDRAQHILGASSHGINISVVLLCCLSLFMHNKFQDSWLFNSIAIAYCASICFNIVLPSRHRWKDTIEMDFKEVLGRGMAWIDLA